MFCRGLARQDYQQRNSCCAEQGILPLARFAKHGSGPARVETQAKVALSVKKVLIQAEEKLRKSSKHARFQFLFIWNDFFIGKIFGGERNQPITAKLVQVSGNRGQDWHLLTSAAFVSMIVPLIVFFSLQRFFVRGLLAGSVKG